MTMASTKPKAKNKAKPVAKRLANGPAQNKRDFWIALALFVVVLSVFYPLTHGGFINYDDDVYVTANYHVQSHLNLKQIGWAFNNAEGGNWHPLTWFSHILDYQLYGLKPWGHHLTSVLIHAINTALLFLVMLAMTGARWRSVATALLFGLHPLRVESVAWISERKDVLCAMFWLVSMWAYARYVRQVKSGGKKSRTGYAFCLVFFACALMSKPMAVTLPFVLLLMDWWPLGRIVECTVQSAELKSKMFRDVSLKKAMTEKVPFFVLSAIGCVVAYLTQKSQGGVIELFPLSYRVEMALIAYARYVLKFFCPAKLAVLYPHPAGGWPFSELIISVTFLACTTAIVLAMRRAHPYGLAGWLWFLGTLVPVIGIMQIGSQAMADRYTYLPGIGLGIMAVWGISDLWQKSRLRVVAMTAATAMVSIICVGVTEHQISFWKDSGALFGHAIKVTENGYVARKALGDFYSSQGKADEAMALYREAIQMVPRYEGAHINLGAALNETDRPAEAAAEFKEAITLNPKDASAYNDLGAVIASGDMEEATRLFKQATEIDPNYADGWKNLGRALDQKGRWEEAMGDYRRVIALRPDAEAHYLLGMDLAHMRQMTAAITEFREALAVKPDYGDARRALQVLEAPSK
jgi:protein O-mannosyl-transferase